MRTSCANVFLAGPGQSTWTGRVHSLPEDLQGDFYRFKDQTATVLVEESNIAIEHLGGGLKHILFLPPEN